MISSREESVYNSYLYASRTSKNKPFRPRRDFAKMADQDMLYLKKTTAFLQRYNHINLSDWFIAPYKVYGMDEYFDLHFYNTRKALKCYTTYIKQREIEDPDNVDAIDRFKSSLHFIYDYCHENKITLEAYINEFTGNLPTFLQHIKEHKINFYMLQTLEVEPILRKIEPSILNFIVSDFWSVFVQTRTKFLSSKVLKVKARKGINLIKTKLTVENNQL
jgi:hypothetical protein